MAVPSSHTPILPLDPFLQSHILHANYIIFTFLFFSLPSHSYHSLLFSLDCPFTHLLSVFFLDPTHRIHNLISSTQVTLTFPLIYPNSHPPSSILSLHHPLHQPPFSYHTQYPSFAPFLPPPLRPSEVKRGRGGGEHHSPTLS